MRVIFLGCRVSRFRHTRTAVRAQVLDFSISRRARANATHRALGDVSAVNLEDARKAARRMAASVAQGNNPSVERKKKRTVGTVLEVIEAYLPHAKSAVKSLVLIKRRSAICAFTPHPFTMIARNLCAQTRHCYLARACSEKLGPDSREPCARGAQRVVELGATSRVNRGRHQPGSFYRAPAREGA